MNFKTTLYLAVGLLVAGVIAWLAAWRGPADITPSKPPTELLTKTTLIDDDFGQATRLTCKVGDDSQEWVFERADSDDNLGRSQWDLVSPLQAQASGWQVDGIVRKLTQLKCQLKYAPGQPGAVTADQAGLNPPQNVVTIENEAGATVTIEIGKDASDTESYVRLAGSEDICVVSPSLGKLLKDKVIEYRDQQLFDFDAKHVKKLEITDRPEDGGEPTTYTLVRSDSGWTFETPVKALAVKEKIDGVADGLSTLRVTTWVEADASNLAMYGLGDAGVTLRATIEEPAEQPPEEETEPGESEDEEDQPEAEEEVEAPEPEPEPVVREVVLHLSRRSPIGEETRVYVRCADEHAVGTITKTLADRLIPNMTEWRDMSLTAAHVTTADSIDLTTEQGSASFKKEQGGWVDAETGDALDGDTVRELLKQIDEMKAVNFVEFDGDAAGFGFDAPQATILLNVPGQPDPERITVGGPTDPETGRLVYVRRNDSDSVAKVRVSDADALLRAPAEYRDRTVFDLQPNQIGRIAVSRQDDLTGREFAFTLGKVDGLLQMVEPVEAKTSVDKVQKLTKAIAKLKADKVLTGADPAEFGFDQPAATCRITYQPPTITKLVEVPPAETEDNSEAGDAESQPAEADENESQPEDEPKPTFKAEQYTPPAEEYVLKLADRGDRVLAMRDDRLTIYQVDREVLVHLQGEYHDPAIFDFQESQVVSVVVTDAGGSPHEFAKVNDQWQYAAEPDLPLDPKKVMDLVLRIKDLKTQRYVAYGAADLATYGLDTPQHTVRVEFDDGAEQGLAVSEQVCEEDRQKRHYAAVAGSADVFLISQAEVRRFEIDLSEYEANP